MSALSRCLLEEAGAIAPPGEHLGSDQVEKGPTLLELCGNCKAKLVIKGVGKSGIVA